MTCITNITKHFHLGVGGGGARQRLLKSNSVIEINRLMTKDYSSVDFQRFLRENFVQVCVSCDAVRKTEHLKFKLCSVGSKYSLNKGINSLECAQDMVTVGSWESMEYLRVGQTTHCDYGEPQTI